MLSPFSVYGEAQTGYQAKTTLAGTRVRTNVNDIGTALQIVTSQFLKDTGATNNLSLLTLTTNTEVGGLYGNFGGNNAGQTVYEWTTMERPDLNTRIRGLSAADNTREFESSDIAWDAYNIDTVEVQRGANSILFGLGSPAGLINASLKQASLNKNSGSITGRYGKHNSWRFTLDANVVLMEDELAFRVDALKDYRYFQQKPNFTNEKRVYGALRYDPKFLAKGSASTSLRVNFETGQAKNRNPHTMPPVDKITPWFQTGTFPDKNGKAQLNMNKMTFDSNYSSYYFPDVSGSGAMVSTSPNFQPWVTSLYQGAWAYFPNPASSGQVGLFRSPGKYYFGETYGLSSTGAIDRNISGLQSGGLVVITQQQLMAGVAGLPFAAAYKNTSMTDDTIFDFYNKSYTGPDRLTEIEFQAVNAHLTQTFLNNRIGVDLVYDKQRHDTDNYNPYAGTDGSITVDINRVYGDGSPNPNVGRPYIITSSYYGGSETHNWRESQRATVFAEFRVTDVMKESWLTKVLGRHVFTGVYNKTNFHNNSRTGATSAFAPLGSTADPDGLIGTALDPFRWFQQVSYLGPDMRGLSSPSGLNLDAISVVQRPASNNKILVFNSRWNKPTDSAVAGYVNPATPWYNSWLRTTQTESENPANYKGWKELPVDTLYWSSDRDSLLTNSVLRRNTLASRVFVYQGFMFGGNVIPMLGWREDTAKSFSKGMPTNTYGTVNEQDPSFKLPVLPFNTVNGQTQSYSLVAHTPMFIRKHLPTGMNVSLFVNKSKNFTPASSRVDVLNVPIPPPSGETKDYGVIVSALNGRVSLKATKYKSLASGADFGVSNYWLAGSQVVRVWVSAKRFEAGLTGNPLYSGPSYNYGTNVGGVFTQTAEDRALQQRAVNATVKSPFITNPAFWNAWKMPIGSDAAMSDFRWKNNYNEPWTAGLGGYLPDGMTATSDNESSGYEFELYFKPTDNWDIAVNASKTQAVQANLGGEGAKSFLNGFNDFYKGDGGLVRSSGTNPASVWKNQWDTYVWNPWSLGQLLEGTNNSELRPWRYNVITNYRFTKGKFKGVNAGGSYTWQDKIAIGYPSVYSTIAGIKSETYDVTNPYWGPTDSQFNFWVGYEKKLSNKINWRVQLNIDNALGEEKLIPINVQPTGVPAAYRMKLGPTWSITNSLEF